MGWLTMPVSVMGGHKTAKSYLDAQLTYSREADGARTEGAGLILPPEPHLLRRGSGDDRRRRRNVFAIVCKVRGTRKSKSGEHFGYKDSAPLRR
jgi:hypothetical protein